jgi:high frequency lysogenization protein
LESSFLSAPDVSTPLSTESKPWDDRTTALAGIFQAAVLVHQLATTGRVSQRELETAVHSLFEQNPKSTEDVYGDKHCILKGLEQLSNILKRNNTPEGNNLVRYAMGMVHLQKKLMKQGDMLDLIGKRLEQSQQQAALFEPTHDNVIANLADIYTSTISTFSFRIQVTGDYNYLQQPRISNQIRAILFSGIRSAILWRQLGGTRLQVIMKRKAIIASADELIKQAKQQLLH